MWSQINSNIPKKVLKKHLREWPVSEFILIVPNNVSDSVRLKIDGQRSPTSMIRHPLFVSLKDLEIKTYGDELTFKAIRRYQNAIIEHVRKHQPRDNLYKKYFHKCNNDMGPFCNNKAELVIMNGSKYMSKNAITYVDGMLWESPIRQIVPHGQHEKYLNKIGEKIDR